MPTNLGFVSLSEERRLRFQLELRSDLNLQGLIQGRSEDDPIRRMAEDILKGRPK